MAIKTKTSRDTYRSNVKIRPLRQNGLEAQYQGLDISEVNIDHAGLAIIGRGGFGTRRDIKKVRKQYIVDVPQEEHLPTAELVFSLDGGSPALDRSQWTSPTSKSLQDLAGETFKVKDQDALEVEFEFSIDTSYDNGATLANGKTAINIVGNQYSFTNLLSAVTGSIESKFPKDTFRFQLFPSGSSETVIYQEEPIEISVDKIKLVLTSPVVGSAAITPTSTYLTSPNAFDDQSESHEWRLNGFHKDNSNERIFYEDLRVDTIQSISPHSYRREGSLFREAQFPPGDIRNNYDANIGTRGTAGIAGDPTDVANYPRFTTHDSEEVLIRQFPKREEIFDTYRGNHQWREDPHYLSPDQQVWSRMSDLALGYHSSLEEHIGAMMDSNFADEQYIDPNPLSGRVDILKRLSRIFDTHTNLIFERHQYSVFDQYLDPIDDFINLQENRYPKEDDRNRDSAFEDVRGKRNSELTRTDYVYNPEGGNPPYDPTDIVGIHDNTSVLFNDYFDQEPLDHHDYIETQKWSRIDDTMLDILTFNANRGTHIDRREWQETDYVYTATGFINSQTSGQDGIIYRELKR